MHITKFKDLDSKDKTIKLSDGRNLGYHEYGSHDGKPLFFFHGWPSSRYHGSAIDKVARELNIRVVSVDRPGHGLSDYQDRRRLLDWPEDVIELANKLRINKFSVLGVSGGGPYSAVCAYKIPERISKAGIVVGLAPTYIPGNLNGMRFAAKLGWMSYPLNSVFRYLGAWSHYFIAKYFPSLLQFGFGTKQDRQVINAIPGGYAREALEPFRNGIEGSAKDLDLYVHDWAFDLSDIKKKIYLWYGEKDVNVPLAMGKYYAKNLPSSQLHLYANEGHLILRLHAKEIIKDLV